MQLFRSRFPHYREKNEIYIHQQARSEDWGLIQLPNTWHGITWHDKNPLEQYYVSNK